MRVSFCGPPAALILLALCIGSAGLARADEIWPPISSDELQMKSEPKAPGAPAIYLYRQVDQDDRSGREVNFVRIKILTEEGRKYADVAIPFLKDQGNVKNIKARTYQPNGAMAEFNGTVYERTIVKAKGYKFLAKTFTLPDVHPGTIIDYTYTIEGSRSLWILSADLFTRKAKFSLKPSDFFGLRWSWPIGLPEGTQPPVKEKDEIRLETQNVPAFQVEDFMPPENTVKYRVEFQYSWGNPETDPTKFWKREGTTWYEWFDKFIDKRKAMEKAVAEIVSPSDSEEIKLHKIYARVQQVRNLSFEREKTTQEEKRAKLKDLNNVEDVWKRGYGSALDLNWLFVALARAAGCEAYSVRVSSRASYFFNLRLLDARQLNTDVVLVKLKGKDLFLDPGSKFAPFGLLPWYETQVQGLRLDKDGGQWVTVLLPEGVSARTERKADLNLSEDGTVEGKLTVTFVELEALELRTDERDQDDTSRKASLETMIKESVPVDAEVELTNKPDWTSPSPTLVAEYHLKVPTWTSGAGRRVLFPVALFGNSEKHVFEHADRIHSLYFRHPYTKSDEISVTLPPGWTIASVPAPITQDAKAVIYTVKPEDNKGSLHISRTLRIDLLLLDKSKYDILRRFFQKVRAGDEQQVMLQPPS